MKKFLQITALSVLAFFIFGGGIVKAVQLGQGLGDVFISNVNIGGTIFLEERADADTDVAGLGQIWVNTATPNELWFTSDDGTDTQLGGGGGGVTEHTHTGASLTSTRATDAASATVTIAHGLSNTPTKCIVSASVVSGTGVNQITNRSHGSSNGTANTSEYTNSESGGAVDTSEAIHISRIGDLDSARQEANITFDATNVNLVWTKVGTPGSDTINISMFCE